MVAKEDPSRQLAENSCAFKPYSRSLRASVGREILRIRAVALWFRRVNWRVRAMASLSISASDLPPGGMRISPAVIAVLEAAERAKRC